MRMKTTRWVASIAGGAAVVGAMMPGVAQATTLNSTLEAASSGCKPGAVPITFWSWAPGYDQVVNAFNQSHPSICVKMEDNGGGNVEYTKLSAAIKAGSGIPDVAEVEYIELPSLEVSHSLVNLVPYGINNYKKDFVPSVWAQVSEGNAVYAMPGDIGPLGFYYNSKLLAKYKITPPSTWAQFEADAATFHKADTSAYLANFDPADGEWLLALMQGWGAFPFNYTGGRTVTIDFTGPKEMAFAKYWDGLLSSHLVSHIPDGTPAFYHDLGNSGYNAAWLMAAWGPGYFAPEVTKTLGDWRAAPLPQAHAGDDIVGSWGGSTVPVFKGTSHPKQAAEFAEYFFGTTAAWKLHADKVGQAFPSFLPYLHNNAFLDSTIPLSGSSQPQKVFATESTHITSVHWPPIMEYVLTEAGTAFANVLNGKGTMAADFRSFQKTLTAYATSEGLTVKS